MLEIVAHDRDPRLPHPAQDRLHVLDVLRALRAVEQDVVPVRGVEVLDRLELEAGGLDVAAELRPAPRGVQSLSGSPARPQPRSVPVGWSSRAVGAPPRK